MVSTSFPSAWKVSSIWAKVLGAPLAQRAEKVTGVALPA